MVSLEILQPADGGDLLRDFAMRPFLNPGSLQLVAGRKTPRWLPPAPGYVYAGRCGNLYAPGAEGSDATPTRVGDLAELVFGRPLLSRFATMGHAGFIFETAEAKALAACLEDDTEIDLPAAKAQRLIESGQRVFLTRDVLTYAMLEAVRAVGRENARKGATGDPWTLRRLFGSIT